MNTVKITYKIDGNSVDRSTFNSIVHDMLLFNAWERVIERNKAEISEKHIAVTFKLVNDKMHVLTDTQMLFKLNYEVKNELFNTLKLQSIPIWR